jgi:hypothetical protein
MVFRAFWRKLYYVLTITGGSWKEDHSSFCDD